MKKLLLIDGHSILNRAFYGLPDLSNSQGLHTNAILGFLNIIFKLLEEEQPTHLCVAFDVHQPTFRHLQYEAYKGTRKPMPEELRQQVPVMKDVLHAMNIRTVEQGGFEADDIIGTLSRKGLEQGFQVTIVSGDRDLLQLATDEIQVRIPKTKPSGTIIENYYAVDVLERYQVTPTEFIDLKGLMGDASDNIPGVPGIGEKTATKIIVEYKSIENAYAHIEEIKPNKAKENLQTYYEQALLSKELATIKLDCPLEVTLDSMERGEFFNENSYEILKQLELKSILNRFSQPMQIQAFEAKLQTVEDFTEVETLFQRAGEAVSLAVQCVSGEQGFLGVLLAFQAGQGYFVPIDGFVTEEYICDKIANLWEGQAKLITIGWKNQLHFLGDRLRKGRILDLAVACYLLNPLKDTYYYDDIARDVLNLTVPSKTELLGKSEITAFTLQEDSVRKVLGNEICVAYLAGQKIEEMLLNKNMLDLYWNIECPTIYSLYDMEKWGIQVQKEALTEYGEQLNRRIQELEASIHEMAGENFNIQSPKQLGEVLFEHMNLPGGKKTKTGYSTNVEVLEKIQQEHPIVPAVLEYRQLTKLKSTYADGLANYIQPDQRIHGKFHQTITATGRISSTEPNLQNIPIRMPLGRMIRKVFIPKEGYEFIDADYSQIELRVLAHLSEDPVLIDAFLHNRDIHATTAAEVFDVPIEEVTPLQRRNAKAVNFGIVYGISAHGLSQDLNISRKEAGEYIDRYFETYPRIKDFLDRQVETAKQTGEVETMYHRIRPVPEIQSSNFMQRNFGERIAMNSPIQGTAADIIKIAMNRVRERLMMEQLDSRLILQIHDELLIEAKKDEISVVSKLLKEEMEQAAVLSVPLEVDVHVANNWYDAK
ncbi:MAG: DNA polymerase I [Lachnospiraceae bacterium]|nr:DNA polymerase I [Lachnospiraceae bacterium]MBP3506928.1 DNA polymerase I [Lachnospiraceae bacterium]